MTSTPEDLTLPRILCLHGGGVTGAIFRAQFRSFLRALDTRFRFVFVDAPFFCDAGPGIVPVYSDWGPFRRWFRWLPSHDEIDPDSCVYEIEYAIQRAMDDDKGTGPWVGLLGFSQGAKLAASMLYEQQLCLDHGEKTSEWKFAVVLAGRAPLVSLSAKTEGQPWMQSAGGLPDGADCDAIKDRDDVKLRLPTIHVHGLQDPGLHLHRRLLDDYCVEGSTTLVEWDGNHRIPLKKADVGKVVEAIMKVAGECGY
jgi:predicted esterase